MWVLLNTKEFLERLIASAVDAIVAADASDGTIILFNQGAENLFGRPADDTVGKLRFDELFRGTIDGTVHNMRRHRDRHGPGRDPRTRLREQAR